MTPRRWFTLALAVLGVIATAAALWIGSGWRALTLPDTFLQVASDTELYPALSGPVVLALARHGGAPEDPTTPTMSDIHAVLDDGDWNGIAAQIVSPDWLRTQTTTSTRLLFRWLDGDSAAMDAGYDLADVSTRLSATAADGLVSNILGRLPACSPDQALALRAERTGTATAPPPLCLPTVLQRPVARQAVKQAITHFAERVGTMQLTFHDVASAILRHAGDDNPESTLVRLRALRSAYQRLVSVAYLLPLLLVSLLVTVGVRSARDFAYWVGRAAALGALIALLPAWLAPAISGQRLRESLVASLQSPALEPIRARLAQDMQQALLSSFLRAVVLQAVIVGLLGLALILIAAWLDRRARKARPVVQPAVIDFPS